jgi:hypothetical protein
MTCRLVALNIDAREPERLAGFWADFLEQSVDHDELGVPMVQPREEMGFRIRFPFSDWDKASQNAMHFDLTSSSMGDQAAKVARALELGGEHCDIGQGPEVAHVVLEDPEGNEFCVIEPGNRFLAGCGFVGALSCYGSQSMGYFWSAALDWPLVWDQDLETAIQSPKGGTKITWGGFTYPFSSGPSRLRFDIVPLDGTDYGIEVDRLVSLGASRVEDAADTRGVAMADPDGYEFTVLVKDPN